MKKRRRIFAVFVLLMFTAMMCIQTGAKTLPENSCEKTSYSEWLNNSGEYAFPVTPNDEVWGEFTSVVDMRAATQLPEALLKDISTRDLLKLVLQYPLLCDINAYSAPGEGYEHVKEQFNGIKELLSRNDAYQVLLEAYDEYDIPKERIFDCKSFMKSENDVDTFNKLCSEEYSRKLIFEDAAVYNSLYVLEFMLYDIISDNGMDSDEFICTYEKKLEQKESSDYYDEQNPLALVSYAEDTEKDIFDGYISTYLSDSSYNYVIQTPSGYDVTVKYSDTLTMCDYSLYAERIAKYNASCVSIASTTFNCHSFAWLKDLRSDYQHIWMNTSSKFPSDPYYERSNSATVGDIATWSAHSAVISLVNLKHPEKDIPEHYAISKWDAGPVVAHYLTLCPYYNYGQTITYYHPAK